MAAQSRVGGSSPDAGNLDIEFAGCSLTSTMDLPGECDRQIAVGPEWSPRGARRFGGVEPPIRPGGEPRSTMKLV